MSSQDLLFSHTAIRLQPTREGWRFVVTSPRMRQHPRGSPQGHPRHTGASTEEGCGWLEQPLHVRHDFKQQAQQEQSLSRLSVRNKNSSHCHLEIIHGCGAGLSRTADSRKTPRNPGRRSTVTKFASTTLRDPGTPDQLYIYIYIHLFPFFKFVFSLIFVYFLICFFHFFRFLLRLFSFVLVFFFLSRFLYIFCFFIKVLHIWPGQSFFFIFLC